MSSSEDSDGSGEEMDTRKLVMAQNRKKKKSGGFQAMGLSHAVFNGIMKRGYKIPTPIQRKTIPVILEGKDVVAMARTGSGKTAAFLVPMLEKLQKHSAGGARALILSPTRELALQTLKFTKELGKFTGLRAAVILGGDKMEDQFSALHQNPDIIIATPGRLLHILVEMNQSLKEVQYVVFDEADRLFEMGFAEQLKEIIHRVPETRQTLLFSATLPKTLVAFARAGLSDPTLIRLDVESKLSAQLKMSFLSCRADSKPAMLLYLLRSVINAEEQTVVFAATKHHVEYLHALLTKCGISNTYIYSSLDHAARKINVVKFQKRQVMVMIVTDLAARGIDIPLLDNVINYNFPAKPKLFVHRVGRVARAGRSGSAYSLVASDELAYLVDLHVFLGRPLKLVPLNTTVEDEDGYYGDIPQHLIDDQADELATAHKESIDLQNMKRVSENAYKQYVRSRPAPAVESVKRAKQLEKDGVILGPHPIFKESGDGSEEVRLKMMSALKNYKASSTIFEINATAKKQAHLIMKQKRDAHEHIVNNVRQRKAELVQEETTPAAVNSECEEDLQEIFSNTAGSSKKKKGKRDQTKKKRKATAPVQDSEHYLPYQPADAQSEAGYSIGGSFNSEISGAVLDFTGDDEQNMRSLNSMRKWDRKRKRFVGESGEGKVKKIKTESGNWIPASYKSNLYNTWREKQKLEEQEEKDDDDSDNGANQKIKKTKRLQVAGTRGRRRHMKGVQNSSSIPDGNKKRKFKGGKGRFRGGKHELKTSDQILKERRRKGRIQAFQKKRQVIKQKRRENRKGKA